MSKQESKTRCIGILTSGGDCPGLNAAIRGVAKAAINRYGMKVVGFQDGFRGLVENRSIILDDRNVSGLLTMGGTILGTSRDKPHKMPIGGKKQDMTAAAAENIQRHQIDCLVCLGGGGTQKNAYHLYKKGGINVLTLPKTIDNDVARTDTTFGFDTAMSIATEAIDRLHTTATSHHRIIVCEIMGNNAGWLALGSGIAGGADVILIPEIPYNLHAVAEHLMERRRTGKRFSIIAIAEGAKSIEEAKAIAEGKTKKSSPRGEDVKYDEHGFAYHPVKEPKASQLTRQIQELTGIEARVTFLGHVQRGGIPSPTDRLYSTLLGTKAAELLAKGEYNVMVAIKGRSCQAVPLKSVAGKKKLVPLDHPWIQSAMLVGTCLGDRSIVPEPQRKEDT
ncbi:ATP-dependent 6-phosphofructokinase [Marispirochaeta sp.]|jgi:ATP-dependent phosphofructokinase / diphosphate-dependent phosphofructokinase|uniref:6-phosphofructokinase n=1 Tax=Marispirochaeta sp. TaxID=2038653 RepID=UPI0029C63EAE|nr:ATP-dependent 6-phosphofructokinase [Marispirochaeta sp.]